MQEQDCINISIESEIKAIAERIFQQFGISKSEAVELFYHQVAMTQDLPFIQRNFNEETIRAVEELSHKESLTTYQNFAEIRHYLKV